MLQLLILTDDFTGALDTGVQFSKLGAKTCVTPDTEISLRDVDADVLVIDTETRHLAPEIAYQIIKGIGIRAVSSGIGRIYKKTDSALRGNIGAELDGLMSGSGIDRLAYIPAFPKLNRYTVDGVLYIGQTPVSESVFGADPLEPVTESYIPDMIRRQCDRTLSITNATELNIGQSGITIFNARTEEELSRIADVFRFYPQPMLLAGCAGFAEFLAQTMRFRQAHSQPFVYDRKVMIMAGSLNPITLKQSRLAKLRHITTLLLEREYKTGIVKRTNDLVDRAFDCLNNENCLILETVDSDYPLERDTCVDHGDQINTSGIISTNFGKLALDIVEKGFCGTLVVTGGDTLMGVVSEATSFEITLMTEIEPGVILSHLKLDGHDLTVVSKSGGMGSEEVFLNIIDYVNQCPIRLPQKAAIS